MKIKLQNDVCVLTSENKAEMAQLLRIWTATQDVAKNVVVSDAPKKTKAKAKVVHTGTRHYSRHCKVDGCDRVLKSKGALMLHVYKAHGLKKDGTTVESFVLKGKHYPIPHPISVHKVSLLDPV